MDEEVFTVSELIMFILTVKPMETVFPQTLGRQAAAKVLCNS